MTKSTPINSLPVVSTSILTDNADDDSAIQEALSQFNESKSESIPQNVPELQNQFDQQIEVQKKLELQLKELESQRALMLQAPQIPNIINKEPFVEDTTKPNQLIELVFKNNDFKNMFLVVLVFFVVSIIPFENFIYQYISLDKIPFSHIWIKAIIAGILFFILSKL